MNPDMNEVEAFPNSTTEGPASNPIGDDPGSRCYRYVSLVAVWSSL